MFSGFPTNISHRFQAVRMRVTGPARLVLLNLTILIIFCNDYKILGSRMCSFLQTPVTSYFFGSNILLSVTLFRGRDSSVGIATRYRLDGPGIESRWGARFSAPVQIGPGAHPAFCTMGNVSLSRG